MPSERLDDAPRRDRPGAAAGRDDRRGARRRARSAGATAGNAADPCVDVRPLMRRWTGPPDWIDDAGRADRVHAGLLGPGSVGELLAGCRRPRRRGCSSKQCDTSKRLVRLVSPRRPDRSSASVGTCSRIPKATSSASHRIVPRWSTTGRLTRVRGRRDRAQVRRLIASGVSPLSVPRPVASCLGLRPNRAVHVSAQPSRTAARR